MWSQNFGNTPVSSRIKKKNTFPDQVAKFVRASSQCANVAGFIPGQGTNKNQPMNA